MADGVKLLIIDRRLTGGGPPLDMTEFGKVIRGVGRKCTELKTPAALDGFLQSPSVDSVHLNNEKDFEFEPVRQRAEAVGVTAIFKSLDDIATALADGKKPAKVVEELLTA